MDVVPVQDLRSGQRTTQYLLGFIALLLAVEALRAARPVMMPLAFAAFLAMLLRPLYTWFRRRLPRWAAISAVVLVILLALGLAGGAVAYAVDTVAEKAPEYRD